MFGQSTDRGHMADRVWAKQAVRRTACCRGQRRHSPSRRQRTPIPGRCGLRACQPGHHASTLVAPAGPVARDPEDTVPVFAGDDQRVLQQRQPRSATASRRTEAPPWIQIAESGAAAVCIVSAGNCMQIAYIWAAGGDRTSFVADRWDAGGRDGWMTGMCWATGAVPVQRIRRTRRTSRSMVARLPVSAVGSPAARSRSASSAVQTSRTLPPILALSSLGVPWAMTWPWSMTAMWPARWSASSMYWVAG